MAQVLLDSVPDGLAGLTDVDFTTLAGHAVHATNLEFQVFIHRRKETVDLSGGEPTDFMFCLDSSLAMQLIFVFTLGKKAT